MRLFFYALLLSDNTALSPSRTTYLLDGQSPGPTARLSLVHQRNEIFDNVSLDAFSSRSSPCLRKEAGLKSVPTYVER